jgi:hypothetical protein
VTLVSCIKMSHAELLHAHARTHTAYCLQHFYSTLQSITTEHREDHVHGPEHLIECSFNELGIRF